MEGAEDPKSSLKKKDVTTEVNLDGGCPEFVNLMGICNRVRVKMKMKMI